MKLFSVPNVCPPCQSLPTVPCFNVLVLHGMRPTEHFHQQATAPKKRVPLDHAGQQIMAVLVPLRQPLQRSFKGQVFLCGLFPGRKREGHQRQAVMVPRQTMPHSSLNALFGTHEPRGKALFFPSKGAVVGPIAALLLHGSVPHAQQATKQPPWVHLVHSNMNGALVVQVFDQPLVKTMLQQHRVFHVLFEAPCLQHLDVSYKHVEGVSAQIFIEKQHGQPVRHGFRR